MSDKQGVEQLLYRKRLTRWRVFKWEGRRWKGIKSRFTKYWRQWTIFHQIHITRTREDSMKLAGDQFIID